MDQTQSFVVKIGMKNKFLERFLNRYGNYIYIYIYIEVTSDTGKKQVL